MKNKLLFIAIAITTIVKSQDIITLKNGEEINAKVIEIGVNEIKYKKEGKNVLYTIEKNQLFSVKYPTGEKEMFLESNSIPEKQHSSEKSDREVFNIGVTDAHKFYPAKGVGAGGTAVTTLVFSGLIGLIPAAICSSSPPQEVNLNIPNNEYSNNSNYLLGYKQEAHKMKKRKIWAAWGITASINLCVFLLFRGA